MMQLATIFEEQRAEFSVVDNKLIEKPVLRSMYRQLAVVDVMG